MKILILTVGGSCKPLVNAIKIHKPDYIYFVCSSASKKVVNGEGKPCKERDEEDKPSIVSQVDLNPECYKIWEVSDPDNFENCYQTIKLLADDLKERFGKKPQQIIANYTGGTKTMSVTLALVALNEETWDLEFNRGPRQDLIKIRGGDVPVVMNKWAVFMEYQLQIVEYSIKNFYYSEAFNLLTKLLQKPIPSDRVQKIQKLCNLCQAFDIWDRFNHEEALTLLEPYAGDYLEHFLALKKITGKVRNTGYEPVIDLLNNAERRAIQNRYDDAVARLYRAVEMLAQLHLKNQYNLDSGNIDVNKLPKALQEKYKNFADEKEKLHLPLKRSYELLSDLGDPLGKLFFEKEKLIMDALTKRNFSILAHGTKPLGENEFYNVKNVLEGFIKSFFEMAKIEVNIPQLPTKLI